MRQHLFLAAALTAAPFVQGQVIEFCRDDECGDCPGAVTTAGAGVKDDCVIYDTETVFGGQDFPKGKGEFLYEAFAKYSEPCDGEPGALMIRSPARLTDRYCGNLARFATDAQCGANKVDLMETFMVQFCCGSGDCEGAGVPWGHRSLGSRAPGGATGGLYLAYPNGTTIEPLAVGKPQSSSSPKGKRACTNGWQNDSYKPAGDWYLATFDTQMVSGVVEAEEEEREIEITYDQTVEKTTSFDVSVGDPFGIISVGVGFEFTTSSTEGYSVKVVVPANESGYVGFTPVFKCTKGTIKKCRGEVQPEEESCTPYVTNGNVQGAHKLVQGS